MKNTKLIKIIAAVILTAITLSSCQRIVYIQVERASEPAQLGTKSDTVGRLDIENISDSITTESETVTTEPTTQPETTDDNQVPDAADFTQTGTLNSATTTGIDIRIEWEATWKKGDTGAIVTSQVYLDYLNLYIIDPRSGSLTLNDYTVDFQTGSIQEKSKNLHSKLLKTDKASVTLNSKGDTVLNFEAKWYLGGKYGGIYHNYITASGSALLSEKYATMPKSSSMTVKNVLQNPELPNGCEVTALTILLNNLGYDIDKLTLTDKYLSIRTDPYTTNFNKSYAGDPRATYSLGCYAGVIYDCATNYLTANGKKHTAKNLTGYDINEIYYQISQGNPVIVWVTSDMDSPPSIIKSWKVDGVELNWKDPSHTVVITGYDKEKGIVYVTDPLDKYTEYKTELFERRFLQMGSQAVVIY